MNAGHANQVSGPAGAEAPRDRSPFKKCQRKSANSHQ